MICRLGILGVFVCVGPFVGWLLFSAVLGVVLASQLLLADSVPGGRMFFSQMVSYCSLDIAFAWAIDAILTA